MINRIVAVFALIPILGTSVGWSQATSPRFDPGWFYFVTEYGFYPLADMRSALSSGMSNGFEITGTPMDNAIAAFTAAQGIPLVSLLPASTDIIGKMGGQPLPTESYVALQFSKLDSLASVLGSGRVWWNLLPEYDQSGGYWPSLRKISVASRSEAYLSWKSAFLNNYPPLGQYLNLPASSRSVGLMAVNVYSFAAHYSYELGVDMAVLERTNDEIGDIQTGISFMRGAARQYDKPWGIDIATWRAAVQSPTIFDNNLKLVAGWSPSYFRRHMYLSYMSGANLVLNEAATYYNNGQLNPLGQVVKEVADFSLKRHRSIGKPEVRTALLLDFEHGFEPKHGQYMQADYVWYGGIPYMDGDHMTHHFLNLLFPGYWKTGTLPAGAPTTPSAYVQALASGADSRPWEPMGESRWGDQFDVILSNASLATMKKYEVIVVLGNVMLNDRLREDLKTWVSEGGTLVINTAQVRPFDEPFLGVQKSGTSKRSNRSSWLPDSTTLTERFYQYELLLPASAIPVASSGNGDPLITKNSVGLGNVYVVASYYFLDESKASLLSIAEKLMSTILQDKIAASVTGPFRIQYVVNQAPDKVMVTLVNNSSAAWQGKIILNDSRSVGDVQEWINDIPLTLENRAGKSAVEVSIPPYDIKIVAFQGLSSGAPSPPAVPVQTTPPNNSIDLSVGLTLRWRAVANSVNYHLQVTSDSTLASGFVVNDSTLTDTTKAASGLSYTRKYFWRVRSENDAGTSAFSSAWNFRTLQSLPNPLPEAPVQTTPANSSVNLPVGLTICWRSAPNAESYHLQVTSDSTLASGFVVNDSTLTDTTKAMSGLSNGQKYSWRVRSKNIGASSVFSSAWNFTTSTSTAINGEEGLPTELTLMQNYPNPFNPSTTITFGLPQRDRVRLTVYNTLGEEVAKLTNCELEAGYHEVRFDGNGLSSGLYFYRVQAGKFVKTKRLLLLR
jgi:hypothetical protein